MKEIRIFVASSKELARERNELAHLVLAKEEEFASRGLRVRLAKWEYVDPRMTEGRTEDRYLDEMYDCDAAFVLFRDIAGMYTREELDKALAMEREGTTRLKAHAILFAADGKPGSDAVRLRESLHPDSYGTWSGREELRAAFLELVERVAGMDLREAPSEKYVRKITAFLAADEELAEERNAFADTVLNVNDLLEQAHRNIRVQLRFYNPANAESVLESSEMGLVLYGTNYRVFGRREIEDIHARVKDGSRNPKRFYVFFRELNEAAEKSLDETFKSFRSDFVTKLGHFTCEFGDANALRLGFLLSLERYAGESVELYSTVSAPTASAFVGREKELRKLHDLLEPVPGKFPAGRLPVITGAGGTGKSELVRQFASQLRVEYPGGIFQIDMERVRTWDDAFLRLLEGIPNNGIQVKDYLGLGGDKSNGLEPGRPDKSDGPESGKPDIFDRLESERPEPLTGAKVRDALLKKARESGRILLVLDNIDACLPFLGRDGGFSQAFPAGFSERVLVNVVATARVCDAKLRPEDWAVPFPLGDLSKEAALELLLGERPDADMAEHAAAGRVTELLGYRALYLRRVPALIGDLYAETICNSFAELAQALEANLLGTVAEETEGTHLPDVLWTMTHERLLKMPLGPECVKLAQVASFFSPDGFPQHILKHLWKTVVAPNQDDRKFARAVEILKHHNIFQSTDPVRLHRLDRAAIMQTAKTELGLEESVGKSLAGYSGMSPEDWLTLTDNIPILGSIPEDLLLSRDDTLPKQNTYGDISLSPSLQARILCRNPDFLPFCHLELMTSKDWVHVLVGQPHLSGLCALDKLDGNAWVSLLGNQPQFADRCPWEELFSAKWVDLLIKQPQFADRCPWPWEKLNGPSGEWLVLIRNQPQFAKYCPWKEWDRFKFMNLLFWQPQFATQPWYFHLCQEQCEEAELLGRGWALLLKVKPQLANRCPWATLGNREWADLLESQPQFADRCPWEKLTGSDWAELLIRQPQFANHCNWGKLSGVNWVELLKNKVQFADRCPWEKLTGDNWVSSSGYNWTQLLKIQPQFANHCHWNNFTGDNWAELLKIQPQFAGRCPWGALTGDNWAELLTNQPQFADHCPWDKLAGKNWRHLLVRQAQFADHCQWEKLDGADWAALLSRRPAFSVHCSWERLDRKNWSDLLASQPQFSSRCPGRELSGQQQTSSIAPDFQQLNGEDWARLLSRQPQFANRCPWEKMDGGAWSAVLRRQPQFASHCAWEKMNGENWTDLLKWQPQLDSYCSWEKLIRENWTDLLKYQPKFADHCPWEKLEAEDCVQLLEWQPQLIECCPLQKINGESWERLLSRYPELSDHCPWEKLNGEDWSWLLACQPQFADHCPWEKLAGGDWSRLLRWQSQLSDKCDWERLEGGDWAVLLAIQPCFSELCPWGKLNGSHWGFLLQWQPQFANRCPWAQLNGSDWASLLQRQPSLSDCCPWEILKGDDWVELLLYDMEFCVFCLWEKLDGQNWIHLLAFHPELINHCRLNVLNGDDWVNLLERYPQFAEHCSWEKLNGKNWRDLLDFFRWEDSKNTRTFASKCPWEKLEIDNWIDLIEYYPEFANRCSWEKLDGRGWVDLLINNPQLSNNCSWGKFDGYNWTELLISQPYFSDCCQWEKLNGSCWACLLSEQPQFADRCAWEKLDGHNWTCLLSKQPQFSNHCPWNKLDRRDWMWLLGTRPEFDCHCPWERQAIEAEANATDKAIEQLANRVPSGIEKPVLKRSAWLGQVWDLLVSSEEDGIVFAIYPEGIDYVVCPDGNQLNATRNPSQNVISKRQLHTLAEQREMMQCDVKAHCAIIASPKTLERIRSAWMAELEETEVELVEYTGFENYLRECFSRKNGSGE